eukprot:871906-Pleurochrysis_carterae.AAC.1
MAAAAACQPTFVDRGGLNAGCCRRCPWGLWRGKSVRDRFYSKVGKIRPAPYSLGSNRLSLPRPAHMLRIPL